MSERPIPRFDAPLANFSTAEPTLAETFFAQMSYSYEPLYDSFVQRRKYGNQREAGYDPFKDPQTKGYELFATSWYHATSPDHMTDILSTIDKSKSTRAVLADAPMWKQFTTGILDPINVVPIPLIGGARTAFGAARRVALGSAAIQTGLEVPSLAVDAVRTAEESALNIASTAFFGGLIGGAAGGFSKAADAGRQRTIEQIQNEFETIRRLENVSTLTRDEIAAAPPQAERRFASDSDQDLVAQIRAFEARGDDEAMGYVNEFRKELGLRELERAQVDLKDPYGIMPTWFTESPAFKMVTTPLKRALQSKYPSAVKEKFVELSADAGITLNLHSIGATARQSVFQRSAQSNARWVATHDKLVKLWADETNAPTAAPMDINIGNVARKLSRREDTYESWLDSVSRKRITKTTELTEAESRAIKVLDDYFTSAGSRLEDVGLLGTRKGIDRRIERLEAKIEELNNQLAVAQTKKTSRGRLEASMIEGRVKGLGNKLAEAQQTKLAFEEVGITPREEDVFFPRFWRPDAIRKDRAAFEKIVYDWYETNPYIYEFNSKQAVWEKKKLSTRPEDIMARVKLTTDRILGESDPANVDNIGFGYGRSKHFRHRQLDIPNALVMDFIETNPLAAMKTYAARIEPRYEYARMFGDDVDGVVFDMEMEMIRKGASEKEINQMRRDYMHLYDRIAGAVIRNPDSLSYKAAFALREFASFSYMGSAGLAALPDFGRILLEYDMGDIIKAIHASTDKTARNMSKQEIRLSGEVIDYLKGSAYLRLQEDMTNNIASSSILNSARNAFYVLNGLTPMTTIAKTLAGMVDSHTIIDHAIRYNKLTQQERTWFARYGFSEEDARRIARAPWHRSEQGLYMANTEQWADSILIPEIENKTLRVIEQNDDGTPVGRTNADGVYVPARYNHDSKTIYFDRDYIEGPYFDSKVWLNPRTEGIKPMPDIFKTPKQWANFVMLHEVNHSRYRPNTGESKIDYENRINEMALKDYREAETINEELVLKFRTGLNSGILNTIMSGTPADKPIITDGVAYLPINIAKQFGFREDPKIKGYARIENGFLGLPFQFYSFVLANVNKTIGAMAQGQLKNRAIGISTMMGLSYMALSLRTPDYIWQDMSVQDRFARSFDMSGVMALYSDVFYTAMHTSLALGGPNITGGILSPKFPQEPSLLDAATGLAGAGPSWLADVAAGAYDFASGNYGEGAMQIVRNLPGARMWFLKDDVNQITRAWAN